MSWARIVVGCVVALLLSGCAGLDETNDKCTQDSDCLEGRVCEDGACKLRDCADDTDCSEPAALCDESGSCVQCLSDSDCEDEQECQAGWCTSGNCQADDQCPRGQICEGGDCLPGCRSERDCWQAWQCIADLGPNGTCVECQADSDCATGQTCAEYQCVTHCTLDAHCTPQVCDPIANECVDCLDDPDCPQGQICDSQACVAGCRDDPDCPDGHCQTDSGTCVECLSTDHCQLEFVCSDSVCVPGCQSDRDCQTGRVCDPAAGELGACVDCLQDSDCPAGYACDLQDHACVRYCGTDDDCFPQKCDPDSGQCVECTANAHCQVATVCVDFECVYGCEADADCPDGELCDPSFGDHGGCGECLSDADCPGDESCVNLMCTSDCSQFECPVEKPYCNPDNNACVECYHPNHCEPGFTCVVATGSCVEGEQGTCVSDDECAADERCVEEETGMGFPCMSGFVPCLCLLTCSDDEPCVDDTTTCNFSVNGVCIPNWEVCNDESDCRGSRPLCHDRECVECVSNLDCADEEEHICVEGTCVLGCRDDADCTGGEHCDPQAGTNGRCFECVTDDHCPGDFATCDDRTHECIWCTEDAHCAADEQCNTFVNVCQPDSYGTPCDHYYDCGYNELCTDETGDDEYCLFHYVPCNCHRACDDDNDCYGEYSVCALDAIPHVCVSP